MIKVDLHPILNMSILPTVSTTFHLTQSELNHHPITSRLRKKALQTLQYIVIYRRPNNIPTLVSSKSAENEPRYI